MAYAHADWITIEDPAARETALRSHIAEVSLQITADVSSGGKSRSTGNLEAYRAGLMTELQKLVTINARTSGRTVTFARKR